MILKHKAELAGRVKLQISGGERGTIDYDWFVNMILDQGLRNTLTATGSASSPLYRFSWGSSSQPVQPTDTDLISPISQHNTAPSLNRGYNNIEAFGWTRGTLVVPRGVAAGNISELATSYGNVPNTAACRALVRDGAGNPTTITVLSDEVLTITWEIRKYWSVKDAHDITYQIDGVDFTTNVSYVPFNELSTGGAALGNGGDYGFGGSLISGFTAQRILSFTEAQGNPAISTSPSSASSSSAGQIFPYHSGYARYNPPIPKTNEFKCDIIWELTLSRRAS